ncbi:MAG: putative peptide zinc metalloprotease protein [Solirubrobacteraceae bacterium]|nr:putative peptide zinc metalloprotease protein [Solirubrobacteraceae bacterium]
MTADVPRCNSDQSQFSAAPAKTTVAVVFTGAIRKRESSSGKLLCPGCRRYVGRKRSWCSLCGHVLADEAPPLELVLEDGTRVALTKTVTIGRAPGSSIRLSDPSVSRAHATILEPRGDQGPVLKDTGSAFGTWLNGQRVDGPAQLHDGAAIVVGDSRLAVERRRDSSEAGRTIFGGDGLSSAQVSVAAAKPRMQLPTGESRPSVRAGWALKRLEAAEADQRWVLRDLGGSAALRFGDVEAQLFRLIDGGRSLAELIEEAERRYGPAGITALAGLLAVLADRDLLGGGGNSQRPRWRERILTPRVFCMRSAGALLRRVYAGGGWRLFTRAGLATLATVATAGAAAFAALAVRNDTTPFVVTGHLGLGAVVFILGRLLVVLLHELAHGSTLVAFGRSTRRCGVKFVLGFPYAFVDTSEALFEPRRRRIAVSGSGPAADLTVGGAFALACPLLPRGVAHDIAFQIALSAYVGALLNLNPLLERDGYHILVDWLRVPNLRRRARERLVSGRRDAGEAGTRAVAWYAAATIIWSLLTAGFVALLSLRYADELLRVAPQGVVWSALAGFWALVLLPVVAAVTAPVLRRFRRPRAMA